LPQNFTIPQEIFVLTYVYRAVMFPVASSIKP
jgi:hypothetical protein